MDPGEAHDALSDVRTTIAVFRELRAALRRIKMPTDAAIASCWEPEWEKTTKNFRDLLGRVAP